MRFWFSISALLYDTYLTNLNREPGVTPRSNDWLCFEKTLYPIRKPWCSSRLGASEVTSGGNRHLVSGTTYMALMLSKTAYNTLFVFSDLLEFFKKTSLLYYGMPILDLVPSTHSPTKCSVQIPKQ
jgi:hypothetical protein